MMDNEADMVTLFVSNEIESFTLLKFGHIYINIYITKAVNSYFYGLQSPTCAINRKIKCNSRFVMEICHEIS